MRAPVMVSLVCLSLLLAAAASATQVGLAPTEVPAGTNKAFNLTLNNQGYKDVITNITIESEDFALTKAFGGQDWAVSLRDEEAGWYNNTIGTNVVFASFPFRATSPSPAKRSTYNFTITLYGETTVQRLHREVIVAPRTQSKSIYTASDTTIKHGTSKQVTLNSTANVSEVSAHFLDESVTLEGGAHQRTVLLTVPNGTAAGEHPLILDGIADGIPFTQNLSIDVIPDVRISVEAPEIVNTSQGFALRARVNADAGLNGSEARIYWQDLEIVKELSTDNDVLVGLIAPTEKGEAVARIEIDAYDHLFTITKRITIGEATVIEDAQNTTEEPEENQTESKNTTSTTKNSTRAAIKDSPPEPRERAEIYDVEPVVESDSLPVRPFIIGLIVLTLIVLIFYTFSRIDVKLFTPKQEKKLDEEEKNDHPSGLSWDGYFDRRRGGDEEE